MGIIAKPKLDPPAPTWKYDLPEPNDTPSITPYPPVLSNSPNHCDDIYLELSRSSFKARGLPLIAAVGPSIIYSIAIVCVWIWLVISTEKLPETFINLMTILLLMTFLWIGIYYWRIDLEAPLDEPIRFNRARRKIYVYHFRHAGLKPFSRTAWGVYPKAYDWDDLRAEFCSSYGPMGSGGLVQSVSLAVVKPGTHKVIERFLLAYEGQEAEMYWALAQLYMQQGPQALPLFERPPRDWNNEKHVFNLARRFAPKVRWPDVMDLESRTRP